MSFYILEQYDRVFLYLERNIEDINKENQGYIVNFIGVRGQDRLQDILKRFGIFEKMLIIGYFMVVIFSYFLKFLMMSDWSYGFSIEYMLFLYGVGVMGSVGLILFFLFELIEMMMRLMFISDEFDVIFFKLCDVLGVKEGLFLWGCDKYVVYGFERVVDVGFGFFFGQLLLIGLEGNINMRGLFRDRFYVFSSVVFLNEKGFLDVVYLCVFMGINILLFGVVDFYLNVLGLCWIRGLDGKQWFVFL